MTACYCQKLATWKTAMVNEPSWDETLLIPILDQLDLIKTSVSHLSPSSSRSWNNLYCVLKPGQLYAYKDAKSFGHGTTYHGEDPLSLANAIWEILSNYKKKKHVCKLRWASGRLSGFSPLKDQFDSCSPQETNKRIRSGFQAGIHVFLFVLGTKRCMRREDFTKIKLL